MNRVVLYLYLMSQKCHSCGTDFQKTLLGLKWIHILHNYVFSEKNMNQIRSEQIKQEKVGLVEKLQRRLSLPHKQLGSRRLSRSQSGYR